MGLIVLIFIVIWGIAIAKIKYLDSLSDRVSAMDKVRNHLNSLKPDTFDDYLDHRKEWNQEKIKGDR